MKMRTGKSTLNYDLGSWISRMVEGEAKLPWVKEEVGGEDVET